MMRTFERRGAGRISTLVNEGAGVEIHADDFGLHINVSVEPAVAVPYGIVRSHSYTSAGVYQNWSGIEPTTKGVRDFTVLTNWVNTHFNAGRKIILDPSGTPNWAVTAAAVGESPYPATKGNMVPDNDSDYTDFVTAMATLYRGKIYAYDGWSEPNLPKYYKGAAATAVRLATIQRKYYQAVKAADPNALVLSPSFTSVFSGVDGSGGGLVGLKQFLSASDGAGGTGSQWFDHCSYHFYCNDDATRPTGLERMYRGVRRELAAVGRTDVEVWATETGCIVPGFLTLSLAKRQEMMKAYIYTLFAFGVSKVLWFSFDAFDIGFGSGSERTAMIATWTEIQDKLVGYRVKTRKVWVRDQEVLEVRLSNARGQIAATFNDMPL